jgi:hypothetical protein
VGEWCCRAESRLRSQVWDEAESMFEMADLNTDDGAIDFNAYVWLARASDLSSCDCCLVLCV